MRLRLAQMRDLRSISEFLRVQGRDPAELEAARIAAFDPRRRVAICATTLIGSSETVVGIGAIDVGGSEPDLLVVDEALTDGLDDLLASAVLSRAAAIASRPAA